MAIADNAKMAWDFFKGKGLSDAATAAILGNLQVESGIDPTRYQNDGGPGRGLAQWTYDERWVGVLKKAKKLGQSEWSMNVQLEYLWDELTGSQKSYFKSKTNTTFEAFCSMTTIGAATEIFERAFERPKHPAASLRDRIKAATDWYSTFKGQAGTYSGAVLGATAGANLGGGKAEDGASETGFFQFLKTKLLDIKQDVSASMMDELVKVSDTRRISPLSKHDYIAYGHRYYATGYSIMIGDSCFVIPPEFIAITSESHSQTLATLRQENTQKIKNGYSKRTIVLDLVFHGVDQINGYKVEAPGGWYYVDGLRQLLAQFKCTPFLPITNETINYTYNIHTVALQSIVCSTMDGFPDVITANVVLQEVDMCPYIETHSMYFKDFIDWDLFRFYYQRQLTETHEYGKLQSIPSDKNMNQFKISILDESVFNENTDYDTDDTFYDVVFDRKIIRKEVDEKGNEIVSDSNFITYIDSKEYNVNISAFQCGYSNMLTNIQMAEQAHPTIQYMGGMDTVFGISFETTDDTVVQKLEECNIMNNTIVRNHRECSGIGFIKLESELVELCGSRFVIIDNVTTSTVPGFTGLFNIQINCVSFDVYQKQNEGVNGMNPFPNDRKGTQSDSIEQNIDGLHTKIDQDLTVEQKLRERVELYPDLKLPTYKEVDEFLPLIKQFRETHTNVDGGQLGKYVLDRYPRTPQRMLHGISEIDASTVSINENGFVTNVADVVDAGSTYDLYVDPDFYVFYPDTYQGMVNDTQQEREELGIEYRKSSPEAKTVNIKTTTFGSDVVTDSDISNYDYELSAQGATELQLQFIALARKKIGATYSMNNRLGPNSYDCSGMISKCLMELGIIKNSFTTSTIETFVNAGVFRKKWSVSNVSQVNELIAHANPGDLLYISGQQRNTGNVGHIAIYTGNGKMVHASSSKNKVCEVPVYKGFLLVLEVVKLAVGAKATQTTKQTVTTHVRKNIELSLQNGDSGVQVIELQIELNTLINAGLVEDGKFGTLTEKAVKAFQRKYGLEVSGIVDKDTSKKMTELANKDLDKSSSKTTISSGGKATYITDLEIEKIARVIAKIQFGKPYTVQVALAQVIFDRLTDSKAKYGNLNKILESKIFKGEYSKSIDKSTALLAVKNVFCNGEKAYEYKTTHYLGIDSESSSFEKMDQQHDRLGTLKEFTFWGDKTKKSYTKKFQLLTEEEAVEADTPTSESIIKEEEINIGVGEITNRHVKAFGRPVVMVADELDKDSGFWKNGFLKGDWRTKEQTYQEEYNTNEQRLLTSFVNQCEYSGKGRLIKAFPTYLFSIVDEDGNWLDGRKLWANYYTLRSLVEIQVASYNDSPMSTATVTVTNSYGNLDTLPPNAFYYSPGKDKDYNWIQRTLYDNFGILPSFGPKLTDTLVEQKNIVYKSMVIRAGCRMHLRMGYGSDPLSLPVVMNGYISDLSVGDITTFVCVSDGVELMNAVISDSPTDVNGMFESQETSNIIIDLMTKRQSWLNKVNDGWGEPNKYGIEHFGLYFSEHCDWFGKAEWTINIPKTGNDVIDSILGVGEDIANVVSDVVETGVNIASNALETVGTMAKEIGDGIFKGLKTVEYDIIKNIYRSSYDGSLAMYTPFWGFIDGEKNMCFSMYNKTPWDAIQMAIQNAPEYVGLPMYHQFESRIFCGLPFFLAKYRYNKINGVYFEEAKAFAQMHFLDSMSEIIDNQMITTSRDVYTNAIVMYTLGKSPTATPTLYSDKSISFSRQSTKIFDSSVSQNILGPDKLWELLQLDMGKQGAIRVGISQLLYNWEKAYQGDVILLGDAGIYPEDYLFINDRFNQLNGLCKARTVVHSLSANTGFTTTITPGMLGFATTQNSQATTVLTNAISIASDFSYYMGLKKVIRDNCERMAEWSNTVEKLENIRVYGMGAISAYLYSYAFRKFKHIPGDVYRVLKGADYATIIKDAKTFGKTVRSTVNIAKLAKSADKFGDVVKAGKTILTAGKTMLSGGFKVLGGELGTATGPIGTIIGFGVGLLLDCLLTAVIDYFQWNNCVSLLPLMHKGSPYAPITSGEKLLLTGGSSNTSKDTIFEDLEGASESADSPGTATNMSDQSGE